MRLVSAIGIGYGQQVRLQSAVAALLWLASGDKAAVGWDRRGGGSTFAKSVRVGLRVAIVGAGLGGLVAALFLRRAGIDAEVYERGSVLHELGAGIIVPPNMVRPLARLGLIDALQSFAVRLEAAWELRRWQDGRVLFVQPMGEQCERLYGAHCFVAHRGDLLTLFEQALPREQIHTDHRCVALHPTDGKVGLAFTSAAGPMRVTADFVIGADGIHSMVREAVAPRVDARFSGLSAFRCLVPAEKAPTLTLRPVQTLWLGPGRHFVHYPISAGRLVNVIAITPAGEWRTESWTAEGRVEDLSKEFAGWDPRLHALIDAATSTRRWALFDRSPLERWVAGRIVLLGDAAHAMLPFLTQGAAQAVEDAEALAACLHGASPASAPEALRRYEALRRPRANAVQLQSRGREIRNPLPDGPAQTRRDAEFRNGDPLRQSAWLLATTSTQSHRTSGRRVPPRRLGHPNDPLRCGSNQAFEAESLSDIQ
jgi:salicylate hydroxylase